MAEPLLPTSLDALEVAKKAKLALKPIEKAKLAMGPSKKARKNKQKKARNSHETVQLDANGFIPNGFTIEFDEFDFADMSTSNDRDNDVEDAPRGGYGSQVLPVASNLPEDYDGDPTDGHEYLFLVRREAAAHPGIKTAKEFLLRQREELAKLGVAPVIEAPVAGPSHRPSVEWRTAFLSKFTNMREVFAHAETPASASYAISQAYAVIPPAADESSWKTYINGRKRSIGSNKAVITASVKGKEKETIAEAEDPDGVDMEVSEPEADDNASTLIAGEAKVAASNADEQQATASGSITPQDPKPPIPAVIKSLDHHTTISLLEHFNTWLLERIEAHETQTTPSTVFLPPSMRKNKKKTPALATPSIAVAVAPDKPLPAPLMTALDSQWIFSLLTVLEKLLSGAEISILRTLARTCVDIADTTHTLLERHKAKADKEHLERWTECIASCWMVVSIVWEVWGQRDMWEA